MDICNQKLTSRFTRISDMTRKHIFLSILCYLSLTFAELSCLEWGLWNPYVGIFCHFAPEQFKSAEETKAGQIVEGAVTKESEEAQAALGAGKDLIKFDLTHNPIAIGWDVLATTAHDGVGAGASEGAAELGDFRGVTIGFIKQDINLAAQQVQFDAGVVSSVLRINMFSTPHWVDSAICLINGGSKLRRSTNTRRLRKRIDAVSKADAEKVAESCLQPDGSIFNITGNFLIVVDETQLTMLSDPNQKVGATISNVAALLTPVAPEVKAAEELVDLAILGNEDTTRIRKYAADGQTAESFANHPEAHEVAGNLKSDEWTGKNCGTCHDGTEVPITVNKRNE